MNEAKLALLVKSARILSESSNGIVSVSLEPSRLKGITLLEVLPLNSRLRIGPYSALHQVEFARFLLRHTTTNLLFFRPSSILVTMGSPNMICSLSIQYDIPAFLKRAISF